MKKILLLTLLLNFNCFSQNVKYKSLRAKPLTQSQVDNLNPSVNSRWIVYNTTEDELQMWNGSEWGNVGATGVTDNSLELTSTKTSDFNASLSDIGGVNQVDSETNITATIPANSSVNFPLETVITYRQHGKGRLILSYDNGVTGQYAQTYYKGDVINLWQIALDEWVVLSPPEPFYETISIKSSDLTTNLTTGTSLGYYVLPFNIELTGVEFNLLNGGSGNGATIDINQNGTSILSTLLTTDTSETSSEEATTPAVISKTELSKGDIITIDHDIVGTNQLGAITTLKGIRIFETYSETFDSGLILNGTFATSDDITLEPEWTIVSEEAVFDGNGGAIIFDINQNLSTGTDYTLTFDAPSYGSTLRLKLTGFDSGYGYSDDITSFTTYTPDGNDVVTINFTTPSDSGRGSRTDFRIQGSSISDAFTIDNVSLTEQ